MKPLFLALFILSIRYSITAAQFANNVIDPKQLGIELEGRPGNWRTFVNTDEGTGTAAVSVKVRGAIYYLLVDKNFGVTQWFTVNNDSLAVNYYGDKFEMVQQYAANGKFYNFFKRAKGSEIVQEEVDFKTKTATQTSLIDYSGREKFLVSYTQQGRVYFLTLIKRTNKLKLYSSTDIAGKEIVLNSPNYLPEGYLEGALKTLRVIKQDKEPDLYDAKETAKLYVGNNKNLWLSFDDNFRYTLLFNINLDSLTPALKVFAQNLGNCSGVDRPEQIETNSFIYSHYLLQAMFCDAGLLVSVTDINTDSLIRQFTASRDSAINFAGSDLIKREENTKTSVGVWGILTKDKLGDATVKTKALKAKEFFRVVSNNDIALVVMPVHNELVMKIGEAHDIKSSGTMMFNGYGAATGSAPPGFSYLPGSYGDEKKATTYFKSQLNAADFSFLPMAASETLYDKIDSIKEPLKDIAGASVTFDFSGHTWFLYWNKDDKTCNVKLVR